MPRAETDTAADSSTGEATGAGAGALEDDAPPDLDAGRPGEVAGRPGAGASAGDGNLPAAGVDSGAGADFAYLAEPGRIDDVGGGEVGPADAGPGPADLRRGPDPAAAGPAADRPDPEAADPAADRPEPEAADPAADRPTWPWDEPEPAVAAPTGADDGVAVESRERPPGGAGALAAGESDLAAEASAPPTTGPASRRNEPASADVDEAAAPGSAGEELADPARLRAAVEAVLLVVDMPTSTPSLAQVLRRPVAEVAEALRFLQGEYDAGGRGLDLREVADGWRLYSREDFAPYVERFILDGQQARLTQAALETLAVIAYRQPVTRSRIAGIRGVSVDAVMRTLLTRGLVEECGADPDTGGGLYRTTRLFLEKVGLRSLDELPSLAPLLPDTSQLDDVAVST